MQQVYKKVLNYINIIFLIIAAIICFSTECITVNAFSIESYISSGTDWEIVGYDKKTRIINHDVYSFTNEDFDSSHYAVYRNAVIAQNTKYDLVVYCKKGSYISTDKDGAFTPWVECRTDKAFHPYKIVITRHSSSGIGSAVSWTGLLGFADLDKDEYVVFENKLNESLETTHIGSNINVIHLANTAPVAVRQWYRYLGKTGGGGTNKASYDTNAIFFKATIPSSGLVFYHGCAKKGYAASLAFDEEALDYWDITYPTPDEYSYTIKFNANGGSGSVPSTITVTGSDYYTVMGDITSDVPTRSGYIFRGWSASSSFSSKRIAYSSSYGGDIAKDGTSATTTSSSWSFSDYCNYTGGSTSSRTLNLYAQWEKDTTEYKIQFNANGGSGSVPSTITKEGTDTSVVMGDISSTVPTRNGYIFKGWSASSSWNSKRIAYSSSSGGSAASDGTSATTTSGSWSYATYCEKTGGSTSNNTLTLYAMWRTAYSHTLNYNSNGGTGAPSSSTVTNDSTSTNMTVSSTQPTRTGYTFLGWNTKADGTGTNYSAGSSVNVGADSTVTLYAQWRLNNYDVTYIDVNKDSGEELNRQVIQKPYNSTVKGIDIGNSTADNAYYNNYALISGADGYTTAVVNENGTTVVYRYFKWLTTDIKGTVSWNDNSNKYQTRPDTVTVRLYRDGVEIDSVTVNTGNNVNTYSFADLLKYDVSTGKEFVYTVTQDTVYSQAALDTTEDKYTTTQDGYNFLNTISNTNKPDDPDDPDDKGLYVSGNIYWNDKDDKLGFRPSEVTITLYQKGEDGEWKPFREPVIVDSKNENHYLFDWLPKYWYDASGTPNAFEYKVEESFSAWYVKDGEMVDAYTITPDNPNEFDFTNTLYIVNPDIPVSEYTNTLVIKTNTEEGY